MFALSTARSMYATPVKHANSGSPLDDSVSTDGDAFATPVKLEGLFFGAPRKATPTKPNESANYKCFVNIAREKWTTERSSVQLSTTLMAQVSAGRDINASRRSTGDTPLHTIVALAEPYIVQAFLSHGADPSVKNHFGKSVLHFAARNPNYKVVRMIWRQLAQTQPELLTEADAKGLTPLHEACLAGNIETIAYLLADAYQTAKRANASNVRPLKDLVDSYQRNLLHALFEKRWAMSTFEHLNVVVTELLAGEVDRFAKDNRHRTPLKSLIFNSVVVVPDSVKKLATSTPVRSNFKFSMKGIPSLKIGKRDADLDAPDLAPKSESVPEAGSIATSATLNSESAPDTDRDSSSTSEETFEENPILIAETLLSGLSPKEIDRNLMLMFKNDIGTEWQEDWRPVQQAMQISEYFPFLPTFTRLCSIESLACVLNNGRSIWHYLANMGAQASVLQTYSAHFADKGTPRAAVDPKTLVSVPEAAPHVLYIRAMVARTFEVLLDRPDAELLKALHPFDINLQSPLHTAATFNNVVALRKLYEIFGDDSQAWSDSDGRKAIHCAVQFDTILSLLEMHSMEWILNPTDEKGRTPLDLAVELRRSTASKLLRIWGAPHGANVSSPPEVASDAPESSDSDDLSSSPPTGPAVEPPTMRRLSLSLTTLPAFLESEPQVQSVRIEEAVPEEEEEDDELAEDSLAAVSSHVRNSSTTALVSAINRAKVRDQEAEEEASHLKAEVERLKAQLAAKTGEAIELEKALNVRPSLEEQTESHAKAVKLQQSNETLTNTIRSLRQHVADLSLTMDDERRSRSSSSPTPPSSPIRESDYKQSLHDYEKHIELLNTQLQQARKTATEQVESNKRQNEDLLAQLRRQLDDTQANLAKEEMLRLEAEERLKDKERTVAEIRSELASLSDSSTASEESRSLQEEMDLLVDELRQANAQVEDCKSALKVADSRIATLIGDLEAFQKSSASIVNAESELQALREEVHLLRSQLSTNPQEANQSLFSDLSSLEKAISASEHAQSELQLENSELRNELESQRRSNDTLSKAVETLDIATQMLKSDNDERTKLLEKAEHELAIATSEADALREHKNSQTQVALRGAKLQMEQLDQALKEIHEKLRTDEQRLATETTNQLSESQEQALTLISELKQLKNDYSLQSKALEDTVAANSNRDSLRISELSSELEIARQQCLDYQAAADAANVQKAKLEAQMGAQGFHSAELSTLFQEFKQTADASHANLSSLGASLGSLLSDNSSAAQQQTTHSNLLAQLQESDRRLSSLLGMFEELRAESSQGFKSLEEEHKRTEKTLRDELKSALNSAQSLQEQLSSTQQELSSRSTIYEAQLSSQSQERDSLSSSLRAVESASDVMKVERQAGLKQLESLESSLSQAKAAHEKSISAKDDALAELSAKLKASEAQFVSLTQELKALQAASVAGGAESAIADISSRLETSEFSRLSLEDDLAKLKTERNEMSQKHDIDLSAIKVSLAAAESNQIRAKHETEILQERLDASKLDVDRLSDSMKALESALEASKLRDSSDQSTMKSIERLLEASSASSTDASAVSGLQSSIDKSLLLLQEELPRLHSMAASNGPETSLKEILAELQHLRAESASKADSSESNSDLEQQVATLKLALDEERKSKETQLLQDSDRRAELERSVGEAKASSVSLAAQLEQARKSLAEKAAALDQANDLVSSSKSSAAEIKADLRQAQAEIERLKSLPPARDTEKDESTSLELRQLRDHTASILAQLAAMGTNTLSREDGDKKLLEDVKGAITGVSADLKKGHESILNKVSVAPPLAQTPSSAMAVPKTVYAGLAIISLIVMAILFLQLELLAPGEPQHYFS